MSQHSLTPIAFRSKLGLKLTHFSLSSTTLRSLAWSPSFYKSISASSSSSSNTATSSSSSSSSQFSPAALRTEEETRQIARNLTRDWRAGDVYSPHDLSPYEMRKWRRRKRPTTDAFDALSLDPLDLYRNFSVMSEYITEMGRIRHSSSTGLRPVNQRKISKAIKRAKALGLLPSTHRHPELLKYEMEGAGRFAR